VKEAESFHFIRTFYLQLRTMRYSTLIIALLFSLTLQAQVSRDTVLSRCPVFITDTSSSNNFFIEARPATLKVYRVKGDLTVVVEQKEQYLTLLFHNKRLRTGTYPIDRGSKGNKEAEATYSFRSGDQVAYIQLDKGEIKSSYDKVTKTWKLSITGILINRVETSASYYRVKAELILKG
jgi:hypothetical protein